ncbi:MAG: NAD(P)-binding domain-containing protein [Candidatus Diapherotrites archaeon]
MLLENDFNRTSLVEVSQSLESNIPGLFVAGDLVGPRLIRHALEQGRIAAEAIAASVKKQKPREASFDLAVIGAGPAGLSAAITAKAKGLSCVVFEREKPLNTIQNYPTGKNVSAEPKGLNVKSPLDFKQLKKEKLLEFWLSKVKSRKIDLREGEEVQSVKKHAELFEVKTATETYRSKTVLLAFGTASNPKRLGIEGESLPKVFHELTHPEKFSGKKILVVGGGNTAIEATLALSEKNEVIISYRKQGFFRVGEENYNALGQKIAEEQIEVLFNSSIKRIGEKTVELEQRGTTMKLENDFVFVLVGSIPPTEFLEKFGLSLKQPEGKQY